MRAPPESLSPITGAPFFKARSITLQIFSAWASESDPPNTVKSWENTYTSRPAIRPYPVTTPSPRYFSSARPKSVERCVTNRSSSTNVPGSSSAASRSRAVILPFSCWVAIRSAPPPSSASARFCCRSSNFSRIDMAENLDTQTPRRIGRRGVAKAPSGFAIRCTEENTKGGRRFGRRPWCRTSPLASQIHSAPRRLGVCLGVFRCFRLVLRPPGGRQHDPMVNRIHLQHLELDRLSLFHRVGWILDVGDPELGHGDEPFDVAAQVHHDALVHEAEHPASQLGAHGIRLADPEPRVFLRLLQAEGNPLVLGIHVQDQHLDLVALLHDFGRMLHALGPRHVGDVDQAVDAGL